MSIIYYQIQCLNQKSSNTIQQKYNNLFQPSNANPILITQTIESNIQRTPLKYSEIKIRSCILTPQKVEQPQQQQQQQKDQDTLIYQGITKYAWDQEGNKVKVFLNLEGIGQLPKENISSQFTSTTVDVKVKGFKGLNHRFSIKKTFDELKDKECSIKVTNNSIVISLIKKDQKNWDQLNFKEKLIDTDPSKLDKQDPQASLMNMMKEMYQNGDDDMKRTIAQAWSKSQAEKGLQ